MSSAHEPGGALAPGDDGTDGSGSVPSPPIDPSTASSGARFPAALLISFASGLVALSYEMVWYRAYAFVSEGAAGAFGFLLGAYLFGIAMGSLLAGRYLSASGPVASRARAGSPTSGGRGASPARVLASIAGFVLFSGALSFLVVPTLGWVATLHTTAPPGSAFVARMHALLPLWKWSLLLVAAAAGALGAVFPLASHFGIPADQRAGARLSYLYIANIIGSSAGSLLTGFVLFDHLSLARIDGLLGAVSPLLAAGIFSGMSSSLSTSTRRRAGVLALAWTSAFALSAVAVASAPRLHDRLYEKLLWGDDWEKNGAFTETVENRHGVISVSADGTIYGGGSYDGKFNTSLLHDKNLVVRAFALAAMRPDAREVLMIGLASGSWAQVVAHQPGLEKLVVIEINPGYLELVGKRPEVASLLRNPKVEIVIDDGRRWLSRNPGRRFDAIVMNTTWHYRGHATNLLSLDFLRMAGTHLNPSGIVYYNTTGSPDVLATGLAAFPHAVRILNFLAIGPDPIHLDEARFRDALSRWTIDGAPVLDVGTPEGKARFEEVVRLAGPTPGDAIERRDQLARAAEAAHVVTDDNMYCEWWSKDAPR